MKIETWFPLAVATCDLAPSPEATASMLLDLESSVAAAAAQPRLDLAWTGDVNGRSDLHRRAPFAWLRAEVEREARAYALALGSDPAGLRFFFQGSWAVLSTADEAVATHAHMAASISAVYYLQVPAGKRGGGLLVFENASNPNSLGAGFGEVGSAMTKRAGPLNRLEACYSARAGRLLLFPSRQPHSVRSHGSPGLRIAITFDIAVVPCASKHPKDRPADPADAFA